MTQEALIEWLKEEYRRNAINLRERMRVTQARQDYQLSVTTGRMEALADVEHIVRSGSLPRHQPVHPAALWRYEQELRREGGEL